MLTYEYVRTHLRNILLDQIFWLNILICHMLIKEKNEYFAKEWKKVKGQMCWGKSVVPISTVQGISVGQWIWSQIYDLIDMTMGRILGGRNPT